MNKSILIVDDDEMIGRLLLRLLQKEGFDVKHVTNGRVGLEVFEERTFDLVITDIIMPEMEGIEFILSLKKKKEDVKIIAMSGGGYLTPQDYLETSMDFGVIDAFSKPFDNNEIVGKIKNHLL
ncbi:MAG: response regulator [Bacteroidales bacterium]|nr:response regulator [Bacteroidales bacterium]